MVGSELHILQPRTKHKQSMTNTHNTTTHRSQVRSGVALAHRSNFVQVPCREHVLAAGALLAQQVRDQRAARLDVRQRDVDALHQASGYDIFNKIR